MKKVLSLTLAILMALTLLVACGESGGGSSTAALTDKEKIEKTVNEFMEATKEADSEKMASYLLDEEEKKELKESYAEFDKMVDEMADSLSDSIDQEVTTEDIKEFADAYKGLFKDSWKKMTYSIKSVEIAEDKKTAEVVVSIKYIDLTDVFQDFATNFQSDFVDYATDAVANGEDPDVAKLVEIMTKALKNAMADNGDKFDEVDCDMDMEAVDGEWKIEYIYSDFFDAITFNTDGIF